MKPARDPYKYFRIEARELLEGLTRGVLQLEKGEEDKEVVGGLLRLAHTLKGASRVVKLTEIAEKAHDVEGILAPHRSGSAAVVREQIDRLLSLLDQIAARVSSLDPGVVPAAERETTARAPRDEPAPTVRVELEEMDRLLEAVSEASVQLHSLRRQVSEGERAQHLAETLASHYGPSAAGQNGSRARLAAAELSELLGRHVRDLATGVDQLSAEVVQVRDAANQLRLLPASTTFSWLERAARDAALSVDKKVDLVFSGGNARLDAHVLSALGDALLHVVRNAVVHGIEPEAERIAAGKPAAGRIEVTAQRRANRVAFACRDDGRGIDVRALGEAALREGRLSAEGLRDLAPEEAFRLLLEGGLTTTRTVNEVSGRGVGLDVVREFAVRFKGEVRVQSEPGRGTTFEILVPVSLSSLPALFVEASGVAASLPLDAVRRTLRLADGEIARSSTGESVVYEGHAVPFVPLARALGRADANGRPRRTWSTVVLQSGAGLVAVGVDRLKGTGNALVRAFPSHAEVAQTVSGASLDAEGTPLLMLDPVGLASAARAPRGPCVDETAPRAPVLVVDDSLTTRMLEQSILQSAGYEVELATSAEEGLQKARGARYGLFLVDVEMPGMDGFEFVARTRADPTLREVPCILVTSRASAEDKRRGEEVGARAYVVKGEFDQAFLLRTIRALVG